MPRSPAGEHPFTIVRNGYSTADVAAFLSEISSDTSLLRPQDLRRVTFQISRRGYDKAEVLAYLTRVTAELEAELAEARESLRRKRLANIDPALAEAVADKSPEREPAAEPDIEIFPVSRPTDPPPPPPPPPPLVEPSIRVEDASNQIAALLRQSHDHAIRLRSQAEADVRSTISAAQEEVDQRRRSQMRELDEQRHHAELTARQVVAAAEIEADRVMKAAQAVLAQAKAEIGAVKALARHNLAEIEEARAQALHDSREILSLGRGMLQSVVDLDRRCAVRLDESEQRVGELLQTVRSERRPY